MKTQFKDYGFGVIGDIHGEFQGLLKVIKPLTHSIIIVAGDCGFGFPDTRSEKIKNMITKNFQAFLEKRDLYLYFIRGNHDNPDFFNGNIDVSTDRFVLLPDYTFLTINDRDILCIGGAVSVDRRFRNLNSSYWTSEEMLDFNTNLINEKEIDIDIDIIIAHTINREYIAYHLRNMPDWLRISFQIDKKLALDTDRENLICESIMQKYRPDLWIHGHYHFSATTQVNNTKIISLNINELFEIGLNARSKRIRLTL